MLRLNMAVPPTPRNDPNFSSLGLIQAAVLGLTDPAYNGTTAVQFIPNMDGFPNGRRLEDDVTRIELQAVSGVVLAAIGLWYDDFDGVNPVSQDLVNVLSYSTGVENNDAAFGKRFPFLAMPWSGDGPCGGSIAMASQQATFVPQASNLGLAPPDVIGVKFMMANYPNPFSSQTNIRYKVAEEGQVNINVYDARGKFVANLVNEVAHKGEYSVAFDAADFQPGLYFAKAVNAKGEIMQVLKMVKTK